MNWTHDPFFSDVMKSEVFTTLEQGYGISITNGSIVRIDSEFNIGSDHFKVTMSETLVSEKYKDDAALRLIARLKKYKETLKQMVP